MPTPKETAAIRSIFDAATMLSNDYAVSGGAENRRDQIGKFLASVVEAAADLADAYDSNLIDTAYLRPDADLVRSSVEIVFMDAIEAEEAAEPRIDTVRQYSTYNTLNGSVA